MTRGGALTLNRGRTECSLSPVCFWSVHARSILGHGHPAVLEAVQKAALDGFSFGAPTEREVELAEEIIKLVPSIEMVRLVSSGTEAGMSAIRLARGATGRKKIIKFEGCYHGHADALLVKAGSGLATFGNPTSAGVPPEVVQHTLVLEYNNVEQIEAAFAEHGPEVACVMIGLARELGQARQIRFGDGAVVADGLQNDALVELAHAVVVGAAHAARAQVGCGGGVGEHAGRSIVGLSHRQQKRQKRYCAPKPCSAYHRGLP